MKKVALIGANGQLGTDIHKVFSSGNFFKIIPLTTKEIDITDLNLTKKVFSKINPDIVVNTAAFVRVDEAEDHQEEVFKINTFAQKNLAELCQEKNRTLVYISTDYVFGEDKKRKTSYKETDSPGPINVYGLSKLAGEYATKFICSKYFIVRVCGLFGAAGSLGKGGNIVETLIKAGKEKDVVKVVDDQILTPTYTKDIAENLKELLKTENYGLYHITSEGQCSWWEFASEIFRLLKMNVKCQPVTSDVFKTRAKRPAYSVLENYNLKKLGLNKMRNWKKNLKLYLQEKGYL